MAESDRFNFEPMRHLPDQENTAPNFTTASTTVSTQQKASNISAMNAQNSKKNSASLSGLPFPSHATGNTLLHGSKSAKVQKNTITNYFKPTTTQGMRKVYTLELRLKL